MCAVDIYDAVNKSVSTRVSPFESFICEINSLVLGNAHNIIPDYAKMLGTIRTYNLLVNEVLYDAIKSMSELIAKSCGCIVKLTSTDVLSPLYNNPELTERVMTSAKKAIGEENVKIIHKEMLSEDFADFTKVIPAVYFHLGTGNPKDKEHTCYHESNFVIEEDALKLSADTIVQFVLDSAEANNND